MKQKTLRMDLQKACKRRKKSQIDMFTIVDEKLRYVYNSKHNIDNRGNDDNEEGCV